MSDRDRVVICLATYNRLHYAKTTLRSTLDNLETRHEISVHIASDGDPDEYINTLAEIALSSNKVKHVTHSNSRRRGYGANMNEAIKMYYSLGDYVLVLEDDWKLIRCLQLDPLIDVLKSTETIGAIRLGYLGFTQKLQGWLEYHCEQMFLVLDPNSPEHHVFSGHPRLETLKWQLRVGPWPEGRKPGETEFHHATSNPNTRIGVAWPLNLIRTWGDLYTHIGSISSYIRD